MQWFVGRFLVTITHHARPCSWQGPGHAAILPRLAGGSALGAHFAITSRLVANTADDGDGQGPGAQNRLTEHVWFVAGFAPQSHTTARTGLAPCSEPRLLYGIGSDDDPVVICQCTGAWRSARHRSNRSPPKKHATASVSQSSVERRN
jgi:hypothetical protein